MAAPLISISLDVSVESVGSSFPRVILVGSISLEVMLTRWRSRVASRSSSPTTSILEIPTAPILPAQFAIVAPSSEFPLAHIFAPPKIRRRRAILIRPGEDIPIGRLYRTHP
ncbi:hypothetical protein Tco_0389576, partial [Tanacetum coccineum]